jgi:hypothetical protein
MSHYNANLRDIEFCLFDLFQTEKVLGTSIFSELDRETAMGMLEEMKRLTENDLAESFVEGDRVGAILNKPEMSLFRKALKNLTKLISMANGGDLMRQLI